MRRLPLPTTNDKAVLQQFIVLGWNAALSIGPLVPSVGLRYTQYSASQATPGPFRTTSPLTPRVRRSTAPTRTRADHLNSSMTYGPGTVALVRYVEVRELALWITTFRRECSRSSPSFLPIWSLHATDATTRGIRVTAEWVQMSGQSIPTMTHYLIMFRFLGLRSRHRSKRPGSGRWPSMYHPC